MSSRLALTAALLFALAACHAPERHREDVPASTTNPTQVSVETRSNFLATYPCYENCHSKRQPNPEHRVLVEFHTQRNKEFHHGDSKAWCYQCHSQVNINRLVLPSGTLVTFDEAYLLCGSCHGDKLRDWRESIHGKTMGNWRGPQVKRSCTACHNPHNPPFTALKPEAPPAPPEKARRL